MKQESLAEIYKRHCVVGPDVGHGDKGGTHSYIDVYEGILAPYRNREKCNFMEIGLAMGLSLSMWREYMPSCTLFGVDLSICFDPTPHTMSGTILIATDATKADFPVKLMPYQFDVVIDDASHMFHDQVRTFNLMRPLMNPGGVYIIEDILDLNATRNHFMAMHPRTEIHDLRANKGRFDDVMVVFRF